MRTEQILRIAISLLCITNAMAFSQPVAARDNAASLHLRPSTIRVYLRDQWVLRIEANGRMVFGSESSPADHAWADFASEDYAAIVKRLVASGDWQRREGWYRVEIQVFVDDIENPMRCAMYVEDVEFLRPWIDRILREYPARVDAEFIEGELAKRPAIRPPTTRPGR